MGTFLSFAYNAIVYLSLIGPILSTIGCVGSLVVASATDTGSFTPFGDQAGS